MIDVFSLPPDVIYHEPQNSADNDPLEDGQVCVICGGIFAEDYGYPLACEECGGDGVLLKIEEDNETD